MSPARLKASRSISVMGPISSKLESFWIEWAGMFLNQSTRSFRL
jgi:hypothetical protein